MSESFQVTFDAANPERLGRFWAEVLGYVMQPPPEGFAGPPRDGRTAAVRARADEIVALGATELRAAEENGEYWIVLQDLEGNEFCLQ